MCCATFTTKLFAEVGDKRKNRRGKLICNSSFFFSVNKELEYKYEATKSNLFTTKVYLLQLNDLIKINKSLSYTASCNSHYHVSGYIKTMKDSECNNIIS